MPFALGGDEKVDGVFDFLKAQEDIKNSQAARKVLLAKENREQTQFDTEQEQLKIEQEAFANLSKGAKGEGVSSSSAVDTDGEDPGSMLIRAGTVMLGAGAPKRGQDLMKSGMDFISKQSEIQKRQYDEQKVRLENMQNAGNYMYELFADSQNAGELEANLSNIPPEVVNILGVDNVERLRKIPWSPEVRDFFRDKALSVKEQASLDIQQAQLDRQTMNDADLKLYRSAQLGIQRRNADMRAQELQVKKKTEGTNIPKAATNDQVKGAYNLIIANVMDGKLPAKDSVEDSLISGMAEDIAGRAVAMQRETPGLEYNEAIYRAVAEAKQAGDFSIVTTPGEKHFFGADDPPTTSIKYKARGKTQDNPIKITGTPDPSKLIRGRWYEFNGQVKQFK
jgi:uncharacterized protein YjbI with pentapeptide repeats